MITTGASMNKIIFLALCIISFTSYGEDFLFERQRGFDWYEDQEIQDKKKQEQVRKNIQKEDKTKLTPTERIEQKKKQLEEAFDLAIAEPTQKNVRNYMKLQSHLLGEADKFGQVWRQVLINNPDLDNTVKEPASQNARHIYHRLQAEHEEKLVHELAKDHTLVYYYQGTCPQCQMFVQNLLAFVEKYNFKLIAVSLDGVIAPELPKSVKEKNDSIATVPALYASSNKTDMIFSIAHGALSVGELEENAAFVFDGLKKQGIK